MISIIGSMFKISEADQEISVSTVNTSEFGIGGYHDVFINGDELRVTDMRGAKSEDEVREQLRENQKIF